MSDEMMMMMMSFVLLLDGFFLFFRLVLVVKVLLMKFQMIFFGKEVNEFLIVERDRVFFEKLDKEE